MFNCSLTAVDLNQGSGSELTVRIKMNTTRWSRSTSHKASLLMQSHRRVDRDRAGSMSKLLSSIVAAALTVPFIAVAANFPPKFNVAPGCKAAAAINQTMDLSVAQNYQSCMDDEEAARQELIQNWSSFTPQDQVRCVGQTQINGMPSYAEVLACLQVTGKSPAQPTEKKSRLDANTDPWR